MQGFMPSASLPSRERELKLPIRSPKGSLGEVAPLAGA